MSASIIRRCRTAALIAVTALSFASLVARAAEDPPALNPFGPVQTERDDAIPGYIEMSDGTVQCGLLYLTRDKRLQVLDEKIQRQREIPLNVVKQIECKVAKEWMEKEWKFKELAKDEKMFTGREYPAREYLHVVTLQDGRTIEGPLSGIVFCQPQVYNPRGPAGGRRPPGGARFRRSGGQRRSDAGRLGDAGRRGGGQRGRPGPGTARPGARAGAPARGRGAAGCGDGSSPTGGPVGDEGR
jgi:hypothetical protein